MENKIIVKFEEVGELEMFFIESSMIEEQMGVYHDDSPSDNEVEELIPLVKIAETTDGDFKANAICLTNGAAFLFEQEKSVYLTY